MSGLTDRELLEGAARAAGIELKWSANPDIPPRIAQTWHNWNPLYDDGDALRLSVKLNLDVSWDRSSGYVDAFCAADLRPTLLSVRELYYQDPPAALRRAIVRAAYEIGSAKP